MSVLTNGQSLDTFLRERLEEAIERADNLHDGGVDRDSLDRFAASICGEYGLEPLELQRDQLTQLPVETVKAGYTNPSGVVDRIQTELMVTWRLPYSGSRDLWNTVPNGKYLTVTTTDPLGPVKVGGLDHLLLSVRATGREQWEIRNDREQILDALTTKVGWVNEQVVAYNTKLRERVTERLLRRVEMAEYGQALDAASDVPLYQAPATEQVPIPLERTILLPPQTNTAESSGHLDPVLAQAMYEHVVQTIEQMTVAMERTPKEAAALGEEGIRNLILFVLNANYRGAAAGEVFNGAGKTDILLRWDNGNAFIGECKNWHGPKAVQEAIDQMLGYVTWRDTKAALILFIPQKNATDKIRKAKQEFRDHETFQSESEDGTDTRADFVLRSKEDEDRLISVALIAVVLPELKEDLRECPKCGEMIGDTDEQ